MQHPLVTDSNNVLKLLQEHNLFYCSSSGCGWCDGRQQCEPGTDEGSDLSTCPAWFYRRCVTPESSTGCSYRIVLMVCDKRYYIYLIVNSINLHVFSDALSDSFCCYCCITKGSSFLYSGKIQIVAFNFHESALPF